MARPAKNNQQDNQNIDDNIIVDEEVIEENIDEIVEDSALIDEANLLQERAEDLGITIDEDDTLDSVREKVNNALTKPNPGNTKMSSLIKINNRVQSKQVKKVPTLNMSKRKEALALVRVKVTALSPNDQNLKGHIFSVANSSIGTIKKFVPFGEQCGEKGYHIPIVIYDMLKKAKYVTFKKIKNDKGLITQEAVYRPRYNIEVLPQLTQQELNDLIEQQRITLQ